MLEFTRGEQAQDRWTEALRLAKERGILRLAQEATARGVRKGDLRFDGRGVLAIGRALEVFTEGFHRRWLGFFGTRTQIAATGKRL